MIRRSLFARLFPRSACAKQRDLSGPGHWGLRDSWLINTCRRKIFAPCQALGADAKAGLLRRMSGMQVDEGDAHLLESVTGRIIGCAFQGCQCARSWVR